jgi:hypothetical protein
VSCIEKLLTSEFSHIDPLLGNDCLQPSDLLPHDCMLNVMSLLFTFLDFSSSNSSGIRTTDSRNFVFS